MTRVTLDTSTLVSAFEFGGPPMQVVELGRQGEIEIAIATSIIRETQHILRTKFDWTEERLEQLEHHLLGFMIYVEPTERLNAIPADPKDNHVVECAVASQSAAIISGDKHFVRLKQYAGIKMLKSAEFLRLGLNR